jgi:molecular chaperone DnaK (HSP70)
MTKDNHLLGNFILNGITLAPQGEPSIKVTFKIDENCIMNVFAVDKDSKNSK